MTLPQTVRRSSSLQSLSSSPWKSVAALASGCLLVLGTGALLVGGGSKFGLGRGLGDVGLFFRGAPDALPLADLVNSVTSGGSGGGDAMKVFQPHPSVSLLPPSGVDGDKDRVRVELNRMRATVLADDPFSPASNAVGIEHVVSTLEEMRAFLSEFGNRCYTAKGGKKGSGNAALSRFDAFAKSGHPHLSSELWKYCSLYLHGGAFLDAGSPLFSTFRDAFLTSGMTKNVAALGDPALSYARSTIHGSVLILPRPGSNVAKGMVRLLVTEDADELVKDPLIVPRGLYALISNDCGHSPQDADAVDRASEANPGGGPAEGVLHPGENGRKGEWSLLEMRCRGSSQGGSQLSSLAGEGLGHAEGYRVTHQCPKRSGYCCEAIDSSSPEEAGVVLMTRHPLLPYQSLPPGRNLPKPYRQDKSGGGGKKGEDSTVAASSNVPFVSTLREEITPKPADGEVPAAPNFFDVLLSNDCLPSDKFCSQCLRNKKGATCESCKDVCPCYCNALCKTEMEKKFVSKKVSVSPPAYRRDPSRLVPRIVHQTWFEDVTQEKYPNMSRLIESWKRSGWEYRFYSDAAAQEYLSTHFPPEVREAYDSIKPGAFKADLFRYCVLLVDGGVYADMDVLLEANLDAAIPGDIGFMTPMDEPGKVVGHRMCLWNGLIASAPGHPFLAKTIETVVNNIRNRFTSVDIDNMLCPNPELSVAHSFDILFTAGPCMLGMSINNLLGRHPQTSFQAGDIDPWAEDRKGAAAEDKSFSVRPDDPRLQIPGRTVILNQNKWDMGAHRFTWEERNLVVAATDMPDYDDRDKLEGNVHYSDTHVKFGIYGLDKLYIDREVANEDIQLRVTGPSDGHGNQPKLS